MTELPKAVPETISSPVDVISSVSPGPVFSLTETGKTDHFGLFSMPEFEFFDLDYRLQSSPPTRAHDPSLSLKPTVEPPLSVPTDQAKEFQPVSSVPVSTTTSESTAAAKTTVNTPSYVLHKSESFSPSYQTEDLVNDPRLFFAGAPTLEKNDFVAYLLQSTNLDARRHGGRNLSGLPLGSYAIERREELHSAFPGW